MSIVRMLHCFVLPKVTFHRNDTAKVEHAKNEQLKSIKTLDIKLKEKCNVSIVAAQHLNYVLLY